VIGAYATLEAGFLAVHRDHVIAAQDVTDDVAAVVEMDPTRTDQPGA
jgi:hypothetical protein